MKIWRRSGFAARARPSMARSRRGGGAAKATPKPDLASDPEGTRALNLTVLRRLDPAVADILATAGHVVVYGFDEATRAWSRKRMEGTLFVVKRNTQPRFQFVLMNRLNTENLVEDLLTDFDVEVQVPYVFYRNAADEIIGIWFYDPQECEEVGHIFRRIKDAYSRASPRANLSSKSVLEEQEPAAGPSALPGAGDTLEQPTSPTMVEDDVEEFLLTPLKAATFVDKIGGTGAVQPNQSFRTSASHNASASQGSALHSLLPSRTSFALHSLLPSRTSSGALGTFDTHTPHGSASIKSASPSNVKPPLLAPMASTQSAIDNAASSLSIVPPLHPPSANHHPHSAPLHRPFPLQPAVAPTPPYGMPLLQPFPPPNPLPFLTPSASYSQVLTREQVGAALLRLAQNDDFINMVFREMARILLP